MIGRKCSDASVQRDMKLWPFRFIPEPANRPMIVVCYKHEEKHFTDEENLNVYTENNTTRHIGHSNKITIINAKNILSYEEMYKMIQNARKYELK